MSSQIKRINRTLLLGWGLIGLVLLVAYIGEAVKSDLDLSYVFVFLAVTIIPIIFVSIMYFKWRDNPRIRYYFALGYLIMYGFVLFTGNTMMVFVYILPMVPLIVLYHDPNMVAATGGVALVLNVIALFFWSRAGRLWELKDHEIQIALILVTFLGAYLAARIYDSIYRVNEEYTNAITMQKEELYQQAEELEAINGQLNEYSTELTEKNEQMRKMTMQTIMTIANTIDAKDEYTRGHSRRVAEYAVAIARETGYTRSDAEEIRFIGLLHDIGKIGVPDSVLNKPGKLSDEEYQLMKDHTSIGGEILKDITMIHDLDVGAKYHHERYDGSGYPDGLKGDEIPEIARIICVADAYDAMTSNRIYRRHLEPDRVLYELKNGSGKQFDPKCCEAMLRLIEEDRLPKINLDDSKEVRQAVKILSRVIDKAEATAAAEEVQLDELTGAFTRSAGANLIQEQIGRYGKGSIFVVDIDGFRRLNEKEGFMVGDMYLKAVAEQIHELAGNLFVSRFGADEFLVYLPETETAEDAESIADYLIGQIRELASFDERYAGLSICVGITQIATEKDRVMVVYENASKALYVAKQVGIGSYFCHRLEGDDDDVDVADSVDLKQLVEVLRNREHYKGGYTVAFPEFGRVYDYISNIAERNQQQVHIVLFTMREIRRGLTQEERDRIMNILEKSIVSCIRNVDATTKYSNIQRVVLLMNLNEDQTRQVINRIMADFYRTYDKKNVEIHYDAADLSRKA